MSDQNTERTHKKKYQIATLNTKKNIKKRKKPTTRLLFEMHAVKRHKKKDTNSNILQTKTKPYQPKKNINKRVIQTKTIESVTTNTRILQSQSQSQSQSHQNPIVIQQINTHIKQPQSIQNKNTRKDQCPPTLSQPPPPPSPQQISDDSESEASSSDEISSSYNFEASSSYFHELNLNYFEPDESPETLQQFLNNEQKDEESILSSIANAEIFTNYHESLLKSTRSTLQRSDIVWIIPEYNKNKKTLAPHKYVHVVEQSDGLSCSCNRKDYLTMSCDHLLLIKMMIYLENPTGLPFKYVEQTVLDWEDSTICIVELEEGNRISSLYSVNCPLSGPIATVHINQSQYAITCSEHPNIHYCAHKNTVCEWMKDVSGGWLDIRKILRDLKNPTREIYDEELGVIGTGNITRKRKKNLSSVSESAIPIPLCYRIDKDDESKEEKEFAYTYYNKPQLLQIAIPSELGPHHICPHCGKDCRESKNTIVKEATLYSDSFSYDVSIYNYFCSNCLYCMKYDGLKDKIFNKNNKSLYTHSLFNGWTISRIKSKTTLTAFHTTKESLYYNSNQTFVAMTTFSESYESFRNLQQWTNSLTCYFCTKLNQFPQILGMDGTSLLIKKEKISNIIAPKESNQLCGNNDIVKMRNIVNKTTMVYIKRKSLRLRTTQLMIGKEIRIYQHDKNVKLHLAFNWTPKRLNNLYAELIESGCKTLCDLIKWYLANRNDIKSKPLQHLIGDLLRALANYVPLFKLSPSKINNTAKLFTIGDFMNRETYKLFCQYTPFYILFYEQMQKENATWPPILTELIKELATKSEAVLKTLISQREKSNPLQETTGTQKELFANAAASGCGYGYRMKNLRPKYDFYSESDKYKKKRKASKETEAELVGQCNKYFKKYSKMSHGLVTMKCLEHEQNIGFHIMKSPESIDEYFSTITMMYPGSTAPSDIIMDNPCNALPYFIYREPNKYQYTQMHSDIFHGWSGHKCGPIFCSRYWKECCSKYSDLNTSSIESGNNIWKRMSVSSMWMNVDTFTRHVTMMMEIQNRTEIRKQENKPTF